MSSFTFKPAAEVTEQHGVFVALVGGTNSGKTYSALRLAKGLAGNKRVAVLDTEGGRTLHYRKDFDFDFMQMDPPHRPERYAQAAKEAEEAGRFGALLIDSHSAEWAGTGGVLEWQDAELQRMAGDDYRKRDKMKMAAWIKPKMAHKAMVQSFLQRRLPIIFSIRGEETIKPGENPGDKPQKIFKAITNKAFLFEVTVSFRLAADRKGIIDLSDPASWKMEGAHRSIFRDGDQLSEEHGAKLAAWARGELEDHAPPPEQERPRSKAEGVADRIVEAFEACTDGQQVMQTVDRTREPLAKLRGLDDQSHFERADAARAAAYQRHMKPPAEEMAEQGMDAQ